MICKVYSALNVNVFISALSPFLTTELSEYISNNIKWMMIPVMLYKEFQYSCHAWPFFSIRDKAIFSDLILERQIKIWFLSLYLRIANEKKQTIYFYRATRSVCFLIKFGFSVIQIIVFLRIWRAPLTLYRKKTLQCINDKYQIKQNKKLLTTPKPNLNDWNIPILMKPNTKLFLHFAMYFLSNSSPCYK